MIVNFLVVSLSKRNEQVLSKADPFLLRCSAVNSGACADYSTCTTVAFRTGPAPQTALSSAFEGAVCNYVLLAGHHGALYLHRGFVFSVMSQIESPFEFDFT